MTGAIEDSGVKAVFDGYPPKLRRALKALRGFILAAAKETDGVGDVVETLKWGQPSYLPARPRVGTTVRIDAVKGVPDRYAMYVHCQSSLAGTYKELYGDVLHVEGKRAVVFSVDEEIPADAVKHCAALALTYHLKRDN